MSISLIVVKQRPIFHRLHKQKRQTLWMPRMSEDSPRWKTFSKGGLCSPRSSTNMENHELTQCSLSTKRTAFPEPSDLNLQTGSVLLFHICKSRCPRAANRTVSNFPRAPATPSHFTFSVNADVPGNRGTDLSLGALTARISCFLCKV